MTNTTGRKTQRRSPKEGSTFRRKDRPGWRGELAYVDALGKRRRVVVSGATEEEARDKLNRERERLRIGLAGKAEAGTVGEWLFRWLPAYQASVRPSTYLVAEQYVRAYLVPALGRIPLASISATDVEKALMAFQRTGRPAVGGDSRPRRPISAVTATHIRAVLRTALNAAKRDRKLDYNAAEAAKPPRLEAQRVAYLEPDELNRLLSATTDDALGPLWALAAATGLRRGELCALRWSDVTEGVLRVSRAISRDDKGGWSPSETKSVRSRRALPLPALATNALERQKRRQAAAKLAAGPSWQDREGRVFTDSVGRPLLPEYVSHAFDKARTSAGLPTATLHQLRHTAATMLLGEGVPLAVISEWLGHSGIAVTAKHYAAIVPELRRDAAAAMDRALVRARSLSGPS